MNLTTFLTILLRETMSNFFQIKDFSSPWTLSMTTCEAGSGKIFIGAIVSSSPFCNQGLKDFVDTLKVSKVLIDCLVVVKVMQLLELFHSSGVGI